MPGRCGRKGHGRAGLRVWVMMGEDRHRRLRERRFALDRIQAYPLHASVHNRVPLKRVGNALEAAHWETSGQGA